MTYVSKSRRSIVRRLGRIAALSALSVGVLAAGAGTAQASSDYEGFEANKPEVRSYGVAGPGGAAGGGLVFNANPVPVVNPQMARTEKGHARLWTRGYGSWATVERKITKPASDYICDASVYVAGTGRNINLEAIDPATWKYINVAKFKRTSEYYQKLSFRFVWQGTNVVVRVVHVYNGWSYTEEVRVDDLNVNCYNI